MLSDRGRRMKVKKCGINKGEDMIVEKNIKRLMMKTVNCS